MPIPARDPGRETSFSGWSNRILLAAVAGILFLTLFPFRFALHPHIPLKSSPLLLGSGLKRPGTLDFSLNVLLFVPFGFGLCSKLRERNWIRARAFAASALAGAAISYVIELVQIYVPLRDSGWEDVVSNTLGSAVGASLALIAGRYLTSRLSQGEFRFESWLSPSLTWVLLLTYLAVSFGVSIPLQRQTRLENWLPDAFLLVGNDAYLESPWRGQVLRLQFWDRAIPAPLTEEMTTGSGDAAPTPLVDYEFSSGPPIVDRQGLLSDLSGNVRVRFGKNAGRPLRETGASMMSQSPIASLIEDLQKTNQFSLRVVCRAPSFPEAEGAIVSIAQPGGKENLSVWQDGPLLEYWFRSSLTTNSWRLRWSTPEVFSGGQVRDILISYNGSDISVFVDGKRDRHRTQLGPGVALAKIFHRGKPGEVQIYNDIYYLAVFFPCGCLLGVFARKANFGVLLGPLLAGLFVAPVVLEWILTHASGRAFSYRNLVLFSVLVAVAALWVNADRSSAEKI